ncbi:hypothetical protein K432DRAFT_303677 [Lepidopterella palustris CBS 459.81]|uniref:Rhodopsin domain-containing protein n=1 Tax=Lepidopterella palustris CBS 459.81 TaxID=1314670 RepID=A0A8E2E5G9_9PEZI|nr:hypothetical protein K432DRAFT_303677 [Lepidopterella palustris CBS 459.81]
MAIPPGAPGPDVSVAPRILIPTAFFLALGLIVYFARMWTRLRPIQRLGVDDLMISIAMILMVVIWSLCAAAVHMGAMGRHNFYVPLDKQIAANRLLLIVQILWIWSVAFVKMSMACMLLRILRSKNWHMFLYATIVVQVVAATAFMFILLLQCRPIEAVWNPGLKGAKCWSQLPAQVGLYSNAAVSIVTDFIFTALPLTFISKMNLPLRQRVVIGSLMCLGLFATVADIVKTTKVDSYSNGGDNLYHMVDLYTWGFLEEEIGIIAVCVPCLKALFEAVLKRMKWVSSSGGLSKTAPDRSGYLHFAGSQRSENHQLEAMRSGRWKDGKTQSQEDILPSKDGQILKTTEVSFSIEEAKDLEG